MDEVEKLERKVEGLSEFELLKADPNHPSLHLKKIGRLWSVRIGVQYRTLGLDVQHAVYWTWIGTHAEYEKLLN